MSTTATAPLTGTWTVDPTHSSVEFQVKHLGIATVRGYFRDFEGVLAVGEDGNSTATGSVSVASVDTNEPKRDDHLRSADFFDADAFPEITFQSSTIEVDGDDITVTGRLQLHGVTKDITLKGELAGFESDPYGNDRVGIELAGQLSRGDYGMSFNQVLGSGNVLVSDKVKIRVDISAVKAA